MKREDATTEKFEQITRLRLQWVEYRTLFDVAEDAFLTIFEDLVTCYSESWRFYHTLDHVEEVLRHLKPWLQSAESSKTLFMAAWFHDAVYKPWRKNNEQQSAVLAVKTLSEMGWPIEVATEVGDAIMATYHLSPEETSNQWAPFVDADSAILGAPWADFESYAHQIREEYRIYPTLLYRKGRIKVLRSFLERDRIYQCQEFHQKFEEQAQENLQKELALWTR